MATRRMVLVDYLIATMALSTVILVQQRMEKVSVLTGAMQQLKDRGDAANERQWLHEETKYLTADALEDNDSIDETASSEDISDIADPQDSKENCEVAAHLLELDNLTFSEEASSMDSS